MVLQKYYCSHHNRYELRELSQFNVLAEKTFLNFAGHKLIIMFSWWGLVVIRQIKIILFYFIL